MTRPFICLALFIFSFGALLANNPADSTKVEEQRLNSMMSFMDSVTKALRFQQGIITLPGGVARMKVPENFQYLNKEQSKYIVEDLWGNLPQDDLLGMLFPAGTGPFSDSSYAFIITYRPLGFVKDDDAAEMNYDEVLADMKKEDAEENARRKAQGASAMYTAGWAAKPYYDSKTKTLHWAINYRVEGSNENTLNYNVMLLGRKGILSLNAIGSIGQLAMVQGHITEVVKIPEFTEGNRYSDYNSSTDKVAAWTIGGLVAGKLLIKAGFFAGVLKFSKFILIGIAALGGVIFKFFSRKKQEDVPSYENEVSVTEKMEEAKA